MKIEVLISCMRQKDTSIIKRSNIQSDVIVINQCDRDAVEEFSFTNKKGETCHAKFISTTERGLSRSRNMALRNATADICLICDDDEVLSDDYSDKISSTFANHQDAGVIAFQIENWGRCYSDKVTRIGYLKALKLSSVQLAFRRKSLVANNIRFDVTLGSGVSKAGGEENKILYDCLKCGLKIISVPVTIGCLHIGESQWFHGFTEEYFFDRGIMTRKLMGGFYATLYAVYFLVRKYPLYHKNISVCSASKHLFSGLMRQPLNQ